MAFWETEPQCLLAARNVLAETCRCEGRIVTGRAWTRQWRACPDGVPVQGFMKACEMLALATPASDLEAAWQAHIADSYVATPLIRSASDIMLRWKPHCKVAVAKPRAIHLVQALLQRHGLDGFLDAVVTTSTVSNLYVEAARRLRGSAAGVHCRRG